MPQQGGDGSTGHPDSLVPWKGSSLTLGDVQMRESQGRRARETGSYPDLRRAPRGASRGAAKRREISLSGHWRRVLYRPGTKTHTLRYGAVSADHHRRVADDLLCGRGRSGPAVRRPSDASLALGDGNYLSAAGWRCLLAAARSTQRRVAGNETKTASEGT